MSEKFDLDSMQNSSILRTGKPLSPAEAAEAFAFHDNETRVRYLETLHDKTPLSVNEAAKVYPYRRALMEVHRRLQKVNR